ncbi:MAG: DUF6095 family protein [Bacteroidetes bacterium]|nr:DUF6095 family protein [Bacteroidota bacterium]MDA0843743.1 DUF6095 family protein [Bacteroidota bacterium]
MDNALLKKGIVTWLKTLLLLAIGPLVISSAFKNTNHILYWPVLVSGIFLSGWAIKMGFSAVKQILDAIFSKKD